MNAWTLVRASLRHHARAGALVAAGAAVGTAVLCGALAVGDSVRASLARAAQARTGRIGAVLEGRDRFFREELAGALERAAAGAQVAPAIRLEAVVSTSDATRRAQAVQVLGVDGRFFALGPGGMPTLAPEEAALNERLAGLLGAARGDEIVVRLPRPSAMSRDLVLARDEDLVLPLRVRVGAIVAEDLFGEFALETGAEARASLFVPLARLQEALGVAGRSNLLLASGVPADLQRALAQVWELDDAELVLRERAQGCELTSRRVFLEDALVDTLAGSDRAELGVLTYFVNELRAGEKATPYSMVASLGALGAPANAATAVDGWTGVVPLDLGEDEIVVGEWLSRDLEVAAGDALELAYFAIGDSRGLEERRARFRVRAVVPPAGLAADPTLMPDFPGLGDAEDCSDWDPGIPIDLERIRDVDEEYWDEHRGTPKAFVSLAAGRKLWANRFGSLTAVRTNAPAGELAALVRERVEPSAFGLAFREVTRGAASPTDFSGLFLGLSIFLIAAAVLLTALFFALAIDARSSEIGILLALGLSRRSVASVLLGEAALLALLGVVAGALAGLAYTALLLRGLEGLWREAVGRTALHFHVEPRTLVTGGFLALAAVAVAILLVVWRHARKPALALLLARPAEERPPKAGARVAVRLALVLALGGAGALALAALRAEGTRAAGLAFGAAVLVLAIGLLGARELLRGPLAALRARSAFALGVSNATRRPGRSFATLTLVAGAAFLIVAVAGNRARPTPAQSERSSGTGGFAFYGRSSLPVLEDLNTEAGREAFGLSAADLEGASIVGLRVHEGDEASCLNPNVAASPRVAAATAGSLAGRFRFARTEEPAVADPWTLLERERTDGAIPAIADATSLAWALKKAVGDVLEVRDQRGRAVELRIVAALADSILQGDLVIAERRFVELFPAESGRKAFLVDAPEERREHVASVLTRALSDVGLALEPANERLDRFHAVQNTYLSIFQWLGGLGLLLGSAGLAVLVLRHALERRGELALARAVGFGQRELRALILGEHGLSLGLGLLLGALAGWVALLPSLASGSGAGTPVELGLWILAIAAAGTLWILAAARVALRGILTEVLRGE